MLARPPRSLLSRLMDAPYLLLSLASLLWAGNIVLGRYVAGHIPPVTLSTVRWIGATLIILPFALPQLRRDLPLIRRSLPALILLAGTGISTYNALSYFALQYTQAVNGLLMQSTAPLLVGVWSFVLYRDRLTPGQVAGILISLCGVVLIISRGDVNTLLHFTLNMGDIWILIALFVYAFYTTILRNRPQLGPLSFLAVIMAIGSILLVPVALLELSLGKTLVINRETLSVLAYVMIGPSIIAYLAFNRGVELVGANRAAPFLHLMPVFGTALAILFLGEQVAWFHFGGYALVIGGITLATLSARSRHKSPPTADENGPH